MTFSSNSAGCRCFAAIWSCRWSGSTSPTFFWSATKSGAPIGTGGNTTPNDAWKLPPIQRFLVKDGHIRIDDAVRKLHFTGTVSSQEDAGGSKAAFSLKGDGSLNKSKFLADVSGGPLLNVDETKPYNFTASIKAGETEAVINGAIVVPFHMDRYNARVTVRGPSLADLYFLTGLVLPRTASYHMTLAVMRDGSTYQLHDINAAVGDSDLARQSDGGCFQGYSGFVGPACLAGAGVFGSGSLGGRRQGGAG